MTVLVLVVGIPGSGKTSWVKQYVQQRPATKIVSHDDIRYELTGTTECDHTMNPQVYEMARERVKHLLEEGNDVVVDATNVSAEEWMAYRKICLPDTLMVCKLMRITPDVAKQNQTFRSRKVPDEIIDEKWDTLQHNLPQLAKFFNLIM